MKKKKALAVLTAVGMLAGMSGCGNETTVTTTENVTEETTIEDVTEGTDSREEVIRKASGDLTSDEWKVYCSLIDIASYYTSPDTIELLE